MSRHQSDSLTMYGSAQQGLCTQRAVSGSVTEPTSQHNTAWWPSQAGRAMPNRAFARAGLGRAVYLDSSKCNQEKLVL